VGTLPNQQANVSIVVTDGIASVTNTFVLRNGSANPLFAAPGLISLFAAADQGPLSFHERELAISKV
jgi:hypothetical protein